MKSMIAAAALALLMPAFALNAAGSKKKAAPVAEGFVFTDVVTVPVTPVKDQYRTGTCWCFAGTGFIEHEILRMTGDTLDLSEMYSVRHCYSDKADRYVRMYGNATFSPGGSLLDVPYVIDNYGLVPESAYPGLNYGEERHVHGELNEMLTAMVEVVESKPAKKITTAWKPAFEGVLDAYLGDDPQSFVYEGVTYTPRSFADKYGVRGDNYIAISSFTHRPFYKPFVLEIADNWLWADNQNVPLDELKAVIDNALANGYSVAWAADISEPGFKIDDGYALLPKPRDPSTLSADELAKWLRMTDKERETYQYDFKSPVPEVEVTQEVRQQMFDSQETVDDHAMVIVGTAVDQYGNPYYKVKNASGTDRVYGGFFYASVPFVLAKTIDIYVNKDAVPDGIASKIGIARK